jgi:hypothetical protein
VNRQVANRFEGWQSEPKLQQRLATLEGRRPRVLQRIWDAVTSTGEG